MRLVNTVLSLILLGTGGALIGYFLATDAPEPWYRYGLGFLALLIGGGLFGATWFRKTKSETPSTITVKESTPTKRDYLPFNRWAYAVFILLACYQFFFSDRSDAIPSLGIALVFDPFNPNTPWNKRPTLQKAWLISHLLIVLVGFILLIANLL